MGTTTTCQVCKSEQPIPEHGATAELACTECGALLYAAPDPSSGLDALEDEPTIAGERHARRPPRKAPQRTLVGLPPSLPTATAVSAGRKPFAATFVGMGPRFVSVGVGASRAGALLDKPRRSVPAPALLATPAPVPSPISSGEAAVKASAPPPPREGSARRTLSGAPPPPPPPPRRAATPLDAEDEPLDLSSPGLSDPRILGGADREPRPEDADGGLFADLVRRDGSAAKSGEAPRSPGLPTPPRSGPSAAALVASTRESSEASGPLSPRAGLRSAGKLPPPPTGAPPPPPTVAPAAQAAQRGAAGEEEEDEGGFSVAKAAAILGAVAALVAAVYFLNAPTEDPRAQAAGDSEVEALTAPADGAEVAANTAEPADPAEPGQPAEPVETAEANEAALEPPPSEPEPGAATAAVAELPAPAEPPGGRPAASPPGRHPTPAKDAKPAPKDEPPAAPPSKAFDRSTAMLTMGRAAGAASGCATDVKRSGMVSVTFLPTGSVASVSVGGELAGSVAAGCVEAKFRAITVPPFEGDPVTTFRSVTIHPD